MTKIYILIRVSRSSVPSTRLLAGTMPLMSSRCLANAVKEICGAELAMEIEKIALQLYSESRAILATHGELLTRLQ